MDEQRERWDEPEDSFPQGPSVVEIRLCEIGLLIALAGVVFIGIQQHKRNKALEENFETERLMVQHLTVGTKFNRWVQIGDGRVIIVGDMDEDHVSRMVYDVSGPSLQMAGDSGAIIMDAEDGPRIEVRGRVEADGSIPIAELSPKRSAESSANEPLPSDSQKDNQKSASTPDAEKGTEDDAEPSLSEQDTGSKPKGGGSRMVKPFRERAMRGGG